VPGLISKVHEAVAALDVPKNAATTEKQEPAVSIRTSVKPDHIVCLECGEKHKMLRRHINAAHNMTEHEYRAKWNLPSNYPLVSPNYSEKRSQLAKSLGLGRKRKG
jgi:predicted transcriptional regulator